MRRNSREIAFKLIYEDFYLEEDAQIDFTLREDAFEDYSKEEFDFALDLYNKYTQNKQEILEKIEKSLKGYEIGRLYKLDLALLCLTVLEVDYFESPIAVAVNENIELAKTYSTEKSPRFLNGVISSIYGDKKWQKKQFPSLK